MMSEVCSTDEVLSPQRFLTPLFSHTFVFTRAVPDDAVDARNWFGLNADGQIYRYSNSNNGAVYYSGTDGVGDGIRNITDYASQRLKGLR